MIFLRYCGEQKIKILTYLYGNKLRNLMVRYAVIMNAGHWTPWSSTRMHHRQCKVLKSIVNVPSIEWLPRKLVERWKRTLGRWGLPTECRLEEINMIWKPCHRTCSTCQEIHLAWRIHNKIDTDRLHQGKEIWVTTFMVCLPRSVWRSSSCESIEEKVGRNWEPLLSKVLAGIIIMITRHLLSHYIQ